MGATFDRAKVAAYMSQKVINGVDDTTIRIAALAKSLAPVRKQKRYSRSRNRRTPPTVGFYKGTSRVDDDTVLTSIAEKLQIDTDRLIEIMDVSSGGQTNKARMARYRNIGRVAAAASKLGMKARLTNPQGVKSEVKAEVRLLHGVAFDADTGRFVKGGSLRRSIRPVPAKRQGKRIVGRVKVDAPYARWVEFPTHRTKAQPYLMPAFKAFGTAEKLAKAVKR